MTFRELWAASGFIVCPEFSVTCRRLGEPDGYCQLISNADFFFVNNCRLLPFLTPARPHPPLVRVQLNKDVEVEEYGTVLFPYLSKPMNRLVSFPAIVFRCYRPILVPLFLLLFNRFPPPYNTSLARKNKQILKCNILVASRVFYIRLL